MSTCFKYFELCLLQKRRIKSIPHLQIQFPVSQKLISLAQRQKVDIYIYGNSALACLSYYVDQTASPFIMSDGGTVKKNKKQIGKDMKSNVKASSVLPPRAVLSSPGNLILFFSFLHHVFNLVQEGAHMSWIFVSDNDRMIGSINKLDYASSSASKKRPADVGTPSSPNIGKGPKPKTENVKHTPSAARTKIITKGGYNTDIVKPTPDSDVGKGPKAKNPGLAASTRKGVV